MLFAKVAESNSCVGRGGLAPFVNVVGPLRSAAVASRGLSPIMSVSFVLPVWCHSPVKFTHRTAAVNILLEVSRALDLGSSYLACLEAI